MDNFSHALLSFARGHLGVAIEQYSAFQQQVPDGQIRIDHEAGTAWVGERALHRSGQLGTFAEDLTFMWAWAKPALAGLPGVEHSTRLRDIGVRHGIPEFTEELLDLGEFWDPKLAADHLSLIALGALRSRGAMMFNHGGRAYTYLVTSDETLTYAEPDPARVCEYLRMAALLLPGDGTRDVVTGYARTHELAARPIPEGIELTLPDGYRLVARVDASDNIIDASMIGPDGRPYRPDQPPAPRHPSSVPPFIPDALLVELAPAVAITMGLKGGLLDFAEELTELEHPQSTWDPVGGRFGFAELPNLSVAAVEIGWYDRGSRTWVWADNDWAGSVAVRGLARAHGADQLAADRVDLTATMPHDDNTCDLLSAAAVQLGGAVGWAVVPGDGGHHAVALIDERIVPPATDPEMACAVFDAAANMLHPLTNAENRYRVMRELVVGYFRHYGIPTLYFDEPHRLMGYFGLYEVRVDFGVDGAVGRVGYGLIGSAPTVR
ncbi:DUF6882 domain-containing protein [Nocardia sp. NPDC052278]|uniref:DUF6882 domain-containing protein n=1 Tax=unclassified Nocardia TaxID=2637762 RepID=UPI0036816DB6